MESPPPEFFEALDKYYLNELKAARDLLIGDDTYSKALLAVVITRHDASPEGNKQVKDIIDSLDTAGNDIAFMFCVMAKEYGLRYGEAKNLLLKRFGKEEVHEDAEEAEADSEEAPEVDSEEAVPEATEAAAAVEEILEEEKPAETE